MSSQGDELEELKNLTKNYLPSIVWPLRTPRENTSHLNEFANHIRTKFNESSANKFSRELNEFSNLRNIALSTLGENSLRDNNSLKALKKYYCQLASMLSRFKDCGAQFSWKDSFGRASTEGDLEFELNNVMYNIAAIHNEFGAKISRNNENSTKEACLNFSSALWWVTELRDNRTGVKPKEMGHDLLTFYHHVLRAQAQECVLSHSLKAGMKPENVAKISAQVASDYEVATKLAQSPLYTDPIKEIINGASIFQSWRVTVEFNYKYFSAMTQLLMGVSCRDDSAKEIGVRIARLKNASHNLESCKKLLSDRPPLSAKTVFEVIDAIVGKKLDKAVRYNDNVYHATIPNGETLPQVEAKLLISPAPFSISSLPEFKDLFSNLVTIEAVQVNSIYSQKKDDLSRQMKTQVEKQDDELAHMMSTLNFDKKSLKLSSFEVPDELIEICAELSMSPNIVDDVLTKLEDLDDKSEEIQKMLEAVQQMLTKRSNRQYEEELKRYKTTHEDALRSTQSLHKQLYPELQQKIQLMSTTNNPIELLPKITNSSSVEDEEVIRKLEKLLDKVDEMKQQRTTLLTQLSQSLDQDDVIKHVVAASSEHELKAVFDKEIQKHNKYLAPLSENLKLQNEMLDTLERVNAQYGQVKLNHRAQQAAYKQEVDSLKKFYNQFKAINDGIDQGLEYHKKMVDLVRNFYQKVQATHDLNDLLN